MKDAILAKTPRLNAKLGECPVLELLRQNKRDDVVSELRWRDQRPARNIIKLMHIKLKPLLERSGQLGHELRSSIGLDWVPSLRSRTVPSSSRTDVCVSISSSDSVTNFSPSPISPPRHPPWTSKCFRSSSGARWGSSSSCSCQSPRSRRWIRQPTRCSTPTTPSRNSSCSDNAAAFAALTEAD